MYAHGYASFPGSWSDRRASVRGDVSRSDRRAVRRPIPSTGEPISVYAPVEDPSIFAYVKAHPWIWAAGGVLLAIGVGVSVAIGASHAVLRDIAKPVVMDSGTAAGIAQALVDEQNLTDTARAPKIASPAFLADSDAQPLPADSGPSVATLEETHATQGAQPQRFYNEVKPVDQGVEIQARNGGSIVIHWSDEGRSRIAHRGADGPNVADQRPSRDEIF